MRFFLQKVFFVLLFFNGFINATPLYSQEPLTRKISFMEGLPSDVVYDLFVDKNGLLYIGTDKGLITYNGVHFDQIGFSESLGNSISGLQQAPSGKIWCRNFANQLFYVSNGELIEDKVIKELLGTTNSNLIDFCLGKNSIYIITQDAFYKYAFGKVKLIYKVKNSSENQLTSMVYEESSNSVFVGSYREIYTFRNEVLTKKKPTLVGQKVMGIYNQKLTYINKADVSRCVIGDALAELKDTLLANTFLNRLSATKNNLWLCTNNGIYEYEPSKSEFKSGFLSDIRVTDIVEDLEGNFWIGSLDEGLFLMPSRKIFQLKLNLNSQKKNVSYTRISQHKKGNYFVATNDGRIIEIDKKGKNINEYNTHWDNNIEFINFINDTILTNYGYFKIGQSKPISNVTYFGKEVHEDEFSNLLIASPNYGGIIPRNFKGIPNYNNVNNKYKVLPFGPDSIKTLVFREKRTKSNLYHKKEKKYYFGFIDGLYSYTRNGVERQIKTKDNKPIIAVDMIENEDGSIWVATSQNGVLLINKNKIINHISTANGLSSDNCRRIKKGNMGLWVITQTGFDFYDWKSKRIKNAELSLCIKGITINDLIVDQEMVALATNQGIYYFSKSILNDINLPDFNFTQFLVNDKEVEINDDLLLDYNQNNINIKFNTIHYRSLGTYNYRYRLIGLDDKWYTLSSNAKNINFLALNPGTYKFQIHIKMGERHTQIKEINFEIKKPFWLQYWFITITVLGLIALLYFVYRWAVIKTRKSEELKEQLALSQLTALRSQMNPHFIFNVLNAVQGLIYSNQKSKASEYLGRFSDLMRRILDSSDKSEVTIEKEFETIELYVLLEKARFDDDFDYNIIFPEGLDLSQYKIPSMIIQPFVENAIKHGLMHKQGSKNLEIKLERFEDMWCITIDDNGIGRKASEMINQKVKKHISFATKAIDHRVKLINKTSKIVIDIEVIDKKSYDEVSLGTRIKIYVPIIDE